MSTLPAVSRPTTTDRASVPTAAQRDGLAGLPPYRAPDSVTTWRLASMWSAALKLDRVGLDDDFFALGGDSLAATVVFAEIERLFGRRLATATLLEASTVAALAGVLQEDPRRFAGQILVPFRETGSRPPLVLIHGHNGRVLFVRDLMLALPEDIPVYAIQAQGLDGGRPAHSSVAAMCDVYADELWRALGARRFFLGGYCFGGILAIEVHRRLVAAGADVPRLIAIDPPLAPRQRAEEFGAAELAMLTEKRSEGLARQLARLGISQPDVADWYAPGAPGHRSAMGVAEALAVAYARFVPQPTLAPVTMIWSQQFAEALRRSGRAWPLAKGVTETHVAARRTGMLTHHMLLRQGLRMVADKIDATLS